MGVCTGGRVDARRRRARCDLGGRRHRPDARADGGDARTTAVGPAGRNLYVLRHVVRAGVASWSNGHAGAGWRELPTLLEGAELARAALLVEGSVYRALVANEPAVADRMPLVANPAPAGRIRPQIASPTSADFTRLATDYEIVVLLQNRPPTSAPTPSKRDFVSFRSELKVFSHPAVLCSFFGDPLGVFVQPAASLEPARADQLAQAITAVDPDHVTCSARATR